jgi:hypothetical protein
VEHRRASALRPRNVIATGLLLALGFAAITLIALEGREVAVVRTRDAAGVTRETRVWVADHDGASWVEAATPERPFYRDLLAQPAVELVRRHETLPVVAHPEPGADGHARIRALLAAKYGWADCWVALLQDTSRSVAIRFDPRPAAGATP